MDKILKYGQFIVILVLAGIIFFQTCGKPGNSDVAKPDTVVTKTSDTFYFQQPTVYQDQKQPVINVIVPPTNIPQQYQPSNNQAELLKQYQDLVEKFLTENKYKDSIPLRDSTGKNVGVVNWNGTVKQNKLDSFGSNYTLRFPTITNTITNTITLPPKNVNQLYMGGGLSGSTTSPLTSADAGFMFKSKKDHLYGLKGGILFVTPKPTPYVGVSSYWKISLRK